MPNPRLYPKLSNQAIVQSKGFDPSIPSPLSQAYSRRMIEQQLADQKLKDMSLSPLDKAVAGLEAVAMAGSAMFEAIQQAPKLFQGEDAYAQAIGKRMYQPRLQPEKSMEYLGDTMDFIDRLQTEYKLPPVIPELAGFQPLMSAATQQATQGAKRGALQAGMSVERALDKPVTDVMNRGGFGAQMLGSFNTNPAQVVKPKGGNWIGGNVVGSIDQDLSGLITTRGVMTPEKIAEQQKAIETAQRILGPDAPAATIEQMQLEIEQSKKTNALNQWIERNVGNYLKKEMGTPEDPVRLMLDKRAQEIEAQFQVDMNRAQRTRARAEAETDPRRQANMMRQAQREEEQATFDRDFAMEHATHFPPRGRDFGDIDEDALSDLQSKREVQGFPPKGMGVSEPAQRWENIADEAIDITRAGDIQKHKQLMIEAQNADRVLGDKKRDIVNRYRKALEDTGKLNSDQIDTLVMKTQVPDMAEFIGDKEYLPVKQQADKAISKLNSSLWEIGNENPWIEKLDPETNIYSAYQGGLGIDHVIDVIKQDVAEGRIRPEQLNKLSMDQAIRRTAEFNMEQAKKMRETAIKQTEGFPVHKEYPEEGFKWIELTLPKDLPEGYSVGKVGSKYYVHDAQGQGYTLNADSPEEAIRAFNSDDRFNRLKDALKYEGDTMGHCVGGYCPDVMSGRSRIYSLRDKRGEPHVTIEVQPMRGTELGRYAADLPEGADVEAMKNPPLKIRQIKGKQNAAPKADYLPYVQDFVRSGEWSDIGDIQNAGFVRIDPTSDLAGRLKQANKEVPPYVTQDELTNLLKWHRGEADDELLNQLLPPPEPPIEGMKAGGAVNISDNPDTMMMELEDQKFAVGGAAIKRVLKIADHAERAAKATELLARMATSGQVDAEAQRALLKAQSGARALPTVLPRAKPKTKQEIQQFAQQTAEQLNAMREGKFLRADPEGASKNAAGKSKKQWEMEQGLTHDIRPLGTTLEPIKTANIEDQLGMLKLGISGDTSISDQVLHRAGKYALKSPSEQQGGPFFGLRRRFDPAAWASNVPVLENLQSDVGEFSRAYGDVPVIGQYKAMGPQGTNFAQHFADANLEAIDITKMSPEQIEKTNDLIRKGNAKSGAFPDFPGIEDPSGAYFYFSFYPELRKHFNSIMIKPDFTSQLGLPDGRVILHAISDPELRDMPVLTSGRAQYQLVPSQDPKNLPLSEHSTYTHNLPRDPDAPVTQTPFPVPAELEFSDVVEYAKPRYKPSEMTRVLQTSSPRQIVDPQHIDEIKTFEDFMRQYAPESEKKKTGGLIKVKRKAGGGIIKKAIQAAGKAAEVVAPATKRLEMSFKDVTKPIPELTEAAQKLKAGQLSREEYEALVNQHKPVTPYSFVPQPATAEDATRALNSAKREKFGKTKDIPAGTPAGLRLDIPAYKEHGVWVNSIHPENMPTVYSNVSSVTDAEMIMPEEKALSVATREANKSPFAVIKGGWNPITEEEAVAKATEYLNHPEWVQVGIDPERHGYYYNRATMEPIVKADEVIQIGPLVLAKNPVTAPKEVFKYARGGAITANDLILTERPL